MKPNLVVMTPKNEQAKQADQVALVKFFESCVESARKGEITGTLTLLLKPPIYEHTRIGFNYEAAVGMCHRMAYLLLRDWDNEG